MINEKKKRLISIVIFAMIPILSGIVMCLKYGITLNDLYIANSTWNDEVLYYKLVEGIKEYGQPLGYFGYNGSFAKIGHLGAWSPVILMFYIIYAFIFGWTMNSPIYCNILLMTIAMVVFSCLVKPTKRQSVMIIALFFCNSIVTRYMLSVVTETVIYSLLVIFLAIAIKLFRQEFKHNFGPVFALNVVACILTLMRPYWLLLMLVPGYYLYEKKTKKTLVIVECGVSILLIALYFWINQNLCAAYFTSIIDFGWLKLLFSQPMEGLYNILHMFVASISEILQDVGNGLVNGTASGVAYALYIVFMLYFAYLLTNVCKIRKERTGIFYWISYFVIMLLAIIFLYDVYVGSRHVMAFVFISMFIIPLVEKSLKRFSLLFVLFIWLFTMRGAGDAIYTLPTYTEEKEMLLQNGEAQLSETLILDTESENSWDNTVVWVYSDITMMDFTQLYALPAGVGINCCAKNYVITNFDALQSKYLITNIGEDVDVLCNDKGKELIAEYGNVHVWKLR